MFTPRNVKQNTYRIGVEAKEDVRVDKYLADQIPGISRSLIKKMIELGQVLLDGVIVEKAGTLAKRGSVLDVSVIELNNKNLFPEIMDLEILFDNEDVIVINKHAGMVVHPGAGNFDGTLINGLIALYPSIREVGDPERPGIVHRLDKDTSGVIVFAKTDRAYRWLIKQFKTQYVNKTYLALVDGHPPTPTGRIEAPIERDPKTRTRMKVGLSGQGRAAVSEYFEVERFDKHSLLEVHPITGRTHQIRVHLSYIGVPVVGDTLYGRRSPSIKIDRFFLHAKSISLRLPSERIARDFEAALPEDMQIILDNLRPVEGRII